MNENQEYYSSEKTKKKAPPQKGIFHGRRCFVCNDPLKGNTCQLSKTVTKYTNTPFSRCLGDVMGPSYEVIIDKKDKSCQRCAAMIQQWDKIKQEFDGVDKSLRGLLTRKYTLMSLANRHLPPTSIAEPDRQILPGSSLLAVQRNPAKAGAQQSLMLKTVPQGSTYQKPLMVILPGSPRTQEVHIKPQQPQKSLALYQCVQCHSSTTDPADLRNHSCKPAEQVEKTSQTRRKTVKPTGNVTMKILKPVKKVTQPVDKLTCRFCDMDFLTKADLVSHSKEHLSEVTEFLECKICSEIFSMKEELEEHEKIHQLVKCMSCLETFPDVDSLATHLTPTLKINTNHCSSCNTSFASKEDFNNHVASMHQNEGEDTNVDLVMKLTYVCTCCQCEVEDYKEFGKHKEEHIANSVAQARVEAKSDKESSGYGADETEHDYAMEGNEPSTSQLDEGSYSDKGEKENSSAQISTTTPGSKKPIYECGMCSTRAETVEKLMEHFKSHKSTKIICKYCQILLPTVNALSKHLQYHTKPGQGVECQICTPSVPLKSKDTLMKHMADLHKLKHQCPYCGEQFRFNRELVVHQNQHPESKKFGCPKCGMRFLHLLQLQRHVELHHRDPKCRICAKVIRNPIKLRQHEARHRNEKFPCTKCERIFKTPSGLRNHMAIHTGEYKYRCDTCERGFMNKNIFIEHTNNHLEHPKPLYKCDVCGKNFFYQGSLWIHRKWHKNPYPYECKLCGKKLRHASVLQVHMRKHRGERPYKCPYCPLNFNSPSTFKRHLMLHTGEYSYKCDDCDKGFTGKNKFHLHRHSVHGDPMPKKQVMTAMDYKVNVPVHSVHHFGSTSVDSLGAHPTAFIVENVGNQDISNDEQGPRVVEVVINEEQQAVSSITLLGDPARWATV